jgi:predicted CXXCH cytochrome family protein
MIKSKIEFMGHSLSGVDTMRKSILLVLLLMLTAMPALALEIFYPADGTYVIHSDFLIIKAGEGVEGLTLEIGGEKSDILDISGEDYQSTFGDKLIVQPNWDAGENTVVVEAYKRGKKIATAKASFYYQQNPTSPPPAKYQRFIMHSAEREARCDDCHDLRPSQQAFETIGANNPCATCHKRMLNHPNVHGPAGAWQCAYCHTTGGSPSYFAPRDDSGALCYECHSDMADELKQAKFVHGPVEIKQCNLCHNPHASNFTSQLITKTNTLCLGCHEGTDTNGHVGRGVGGSTHPLEANVDLSNPSRPMSCISCHNPHSGVVEYYFVDGLTNRMMLCQNCHKK